MPMYWLSSCQVPYYSKNFANCMSLKTSVFGILSKICVTLPVQCKVFIYNSSAEADQFLGSTHFHLAPDTD